MSATTEPYAQVLALLEIFDGALQYCNVPPARRREFERAEVAGAILFDERTDSYVHPRAVRVLEAKGSWSMIRSASA